MEAIDYSDYNRLVADGYERSGHTYQLSMEMKCVDKVVAGTNYLMTVLVSTSNCTTDRHFDSEKCVVVNEDKR